MGMFGKSVDMMLYIVLVTTGDLLFVYFFAWGKRKLHSAQTVSCKPLTHQHFNFSVIKITCNKLPMQGTVISSNTFVSWNSY